MRCRCCNLPMGDVPLNPHTGDLDDFCSTCKVLSRDSIADIEYVHGICSESIFNQLRLNGKLAVAEIDYSHDLLLNN